MADQTRRSWWRSDSMQLGLKVGAAIMMIVVMVALPVELREKLDGWYKAWWVFAWAGFGVLVVAIGLSGLIHGDSRDQESQRRP